MPAKSDPREEFAGSEYFYRRSLSVRENLPAMAVGAAVGLAAFYIARLFVQRTSLTPSVVVPRRRVPGRPLHGG